jgi:hypothetical protein
MRDTGVPLQTHWLLAVPHMTSPDTFNIHDEMETSPHFPEPCGVTLILFDVVTRRYYGTLRDTCVGPVCKAQWEWSHSP